MSNLPPGCGVNDLPGNRPDEIAEEAFWTTILPGALEQRFPEAAELLQRALWDKYGNEALVEAIDRYAECARDIGYATGFGEGRAEEQMAQAAREMDAAEDAGAY